MTDLRSTSTCSNRDIQQVDCVHHSRAVEFGTVRRKSLHNAYRNFASILLP